MVLRLRLRLRPSWCRLACRRLYSDLGNKKSPLQTSTFLRNDPGQYSRFTPLPNKWSKGGPVYTGRPVTASSMEYYTEFMDPRSLPHKDLLRKDVMMTLNRSLKRHMVMRVTTGTDNCSALNDLKPGDLVETCSRSGETHFGILMNYTPGEIKCLTLKGVMVLDTNLNPISLAISGVYGRSVDMLTEDEGALRLQLLWHLKLLVRDALKLAKTVSTTKLPVVHSHFARTTNLEALDLMVVARTIFSHKDVPYKLRAKDILAAYFALQYQDPRACRPSIETGFFSLSSSVHTAIDKIMNNLSQHELDQYVNTLVRATNGSLGEKFDESLSSISPLLVLLYHYSLIPDAKIADIISTLLSRIYPDLDSDSWLTSPSSVENLLEATGLFNVKENYLGSPYGVCWKLPASSVLVDDLDSSIVAAYESSKTAIPVASTVDDDSADFLFSFDQADDLAVSIAKFSDDTDSLSIYLPDMRQFGVIDSELIQLLVKRGKSLELPQGFLSLIPREIRKDLSFQNGGENEASFLKITLQIHRETNRLLWDTVNINFVRIKDFKQVKKLDARELDDEGFNSTISNRTLDPLKRIYKLMYEIRQERCHKGAVLDYSTASRAYAQPIHQIPYTSLHMIHEARLLAGRIFGTFTSHNNIPMIYTAQGYQEEFDMDEFEILSIQRRIDGTLPESCRAQLDAAYLAQEFTSLEPSTHKGLAVDNYVDIGFPMDNSAHCILQLAFSSGYKWGLGSILHEKSPLRGLFDRSLLQSNAQNRLLDWFKKSMVKYYKLVQLQNELQNLEGGYYIFRCVIVNTAKYPAIAKGYCYELGMTIDIALLPGTTVRVGNTVVCTEILELNAADRLIVVGL